MTLVEILKQEAETTFNVTEALIRRVQPGTLGWKPATGQNWMAVGQLVMHCTNSCGMAIRGFLTGDWGLPEGVRFEDMKPEEMLQPASALPTVESVEQALELLAKDRALTFELLSQVSEAELLTRMLAAPWGGPTITLFQQLYNMIAHMGQHKGQLFYYLKLMGQDVNTMDLYGV
jgi:uncharacterized damage-inducible protein DinB